MPCLTRDTLKAPCHLKRDQFPIGDSYLLVQELPAPTLVQLQTSYKADAPETARMNYLYDILAVSLVDDEGQFLYQSADDLKCNCMVSVKTLGEVLDFALRLNGFSDAKKN